jgi:sirohydrochlorin ferrochelatase
MLIPSSLVPSLSSELTLLLIPSSLVPCLSSFFMKYIFVDNGSLRAESVLNLRRVARLLSEKEGFEVVPASLLHSSKIPAEELENVPAVNLEKRLRIWLEEGEREFTIIPFFFGPTGAIVDYLPKRLSVLKEKFGDFDIRRTPFLFDQDGVEGNRQLVSILADKVRSKIRKENLIHPKVALVDHGSPLREVTLVRNRLATMLAEELGELVEIVAPASMERRPEAAYDFNEPLLQNLLKESEWNSSNVVIAMLFLSPGRHAGPVGDIENICSAVRLNNPGLKTFMTELVGTHPGISELLSCRLRDKRLPLE